jgi:hypothetical protein
MRFTQKNATRLIKIIWLPTKKFPRNVFRTDGVIAFAKYNNKVCGLESSVS